MLLKVDVKNHKNCCGYEQIIADAFSYITEQSFHYYYAINITYQSITFYYLLG